MAPYDPFEPIELKIEKDLFKLPEVSGSFVVENNLSIQENNISYNGSLNIYNGEKGLHLQNNGSITARHGNEWEPLTTDEIVKYVLDKKGLTAGEMLKYLEDLK